MSYIHDPIAAFTHLHGVPPPGMPARMTSAERERAEREQAERAQAEAEAKAVQEDPPQPVPAEAGREVAAASAADGGGSPPQATALAANPLHHPADGPPPLLSQSKGGEDTAPAEPEPHERVLAWMNEHWDLVLAMATAGEAPVRAPPERPEAAGEPAPPPLTPVHVARDDRWNKHKMARFLRELAATQNVSKAARSVGMSRESAHRLRNRLKGQPFDVAWEAASRHGYDALADAALGRAINGVEVPHYYQGEEIGSHAKFDERLTVALLKMRNDEGAPTIGRYGAAAEWMTERWDAALARIETGSVDWSDERRALSEAELARLDLPDEKARIDALIQKHLPGQGPKAPFRK